MLAALGSIAAQQPKANQKTYDEVLWLLNYAASHPGATIRYYGSDIILHVQSNAYYLSDPKSQSRASGHYFLSNRSPDPTRAPNTNPTLNGSIHTVYKIMRNVMSSAVEAKTGSTFLNGQEAVPICTNLAELRHNQLATPICVDNSTAEGFAKTKPSNRNGQKPSTCAFTGSKTGPSKISYISTEI